MRLLIFCVLVAAAYGAPPKRVPENTRSTEMLPQPPEQEESEGAFESDIMLTQEQKTKLQAIMIDAQNSITHGDENTNSSEMLPQPPEQEESEGAFESDIMLTQEQKAKLQAIIIDAQNSRTKRKARSDLFKRWSNAVVPYTISAESTPDSSVISLGMEHWEAYTCVTFVPRTTESDYVNFVRNKKCSSYVGKIGGAQNISIGNGCGYVGTVVHEIGHAIGFWHEQSRPDRDDYVRIHWENIEEGKEHNFNKYSWQQIVTHDIPYDVGSIMHYGRYEFSKSRAQKLETITAVNPNDNGKLGQRKGLSRADVALSRALYPENDVPCTNGWDSWGGRRYKYFVNPLSWKGARDYCRRINTKLVHIDSYEENAFVDSLVGSGKTWIGLNDRDEEGTFKWIDSGSTSYLNWGVGEPNNLNSENCVKLNSYGKWNNLPCSKKVNFVCETKF